MPQERHYIFELIGLSSYNRRLGFGIVIADAIQTGANDVYVVNQIGITRQRQILIPVIDSVVLDINLDTQTYQ